MMLEVGNLHAYYGKSHILQGVDLCINAGEVVSLLGRNGVGRSTTVKAIMGEVAPQGTIKFRGTDIVGMPSFRISHLGLGYVSDFLKQIEYWQHRPRAFPDFHRGAFGQNARNVIR